MGHLSDRFPYPSIMAISALGSALSAFFLWGFASTSVFLYFFAVIFGALVSTAVLPVLSHPDGFRRLQSGGFSSAWPNAAAECAGSQPEYAGMAFSGTAFFKGISAVVGPIIAGLLLEAGQSITMGHGFGRFGYGAVEPFVGSCALISGVGSVAVAMERQWILA